MVAIEIMPERTYFTIIPNYVEDMGLSVYACRLYWHFKRIAGENGKCYQSTKQIADHCRMSAGMVSKAKEELKNAGLITITHTTNGDNRVGRDQVRIVDIWGKNAEQYSSHEEERSCGERERSCGERSVHQVNAKEELFKEEPVKEEEDAKKDENPKKEKNAQKENRTISVNARDVNDALFQEIMTVCQHTDHTITPAIARHISAAAERLAAQGATSDDVRLFAEYWRTCDWRGKKGDPIEPRNIIAEWRRFTEWRDRRAIVAEWDGWIERRMPMPT